MKRRAKKVIDQAALADHGGDERVERVWERLEGNLAAHVGARPRSRRERPSWLALAALVVGFAGGVLVSGWRKAPELPAAHAGREAAASEPRTQVFAAGASRRRYALPGGGELEVSAGATVDTVSDDARGLTLDLLRGEATVSTRGDGGTRTASLTVRAGDVDVVAGSIVAGAARFELERHGKHLGVRVLEGSVDVTAPDASGGSRTVRLSAVDKDNHRHDFLPALETAANDEQDRKSRAPQHGQHGASRDKKSEGSQTLPAWASACAAYEYERAFELLDKQGDVSGALAHATNEQRQCIGSGARHKRVDIAIEALKPLADDSSDKARALIATADLARIYEEKGNIEQQRVYEQRKEILSKGELLSEPALCEKIQLELQTGAYRTVLQYAEQYSAQYPSGSCTDTVNRAADEAKAKLAAPKHEPGESADGPTYDE